MNNPEKDNIIEKIKSLDLKESYKLFNELSKLDDKIFIDFIKYTQDNDFWEKIINILISNKILIMPLTKSFGCFDSICSKQLIFWKIFFKKMKNSKVMIKISTAPEYFYDSFLTIGWYGGQSLWDYMIKTIDNDEFWENLSNNSTILFDKWANSTIINASIKIKNENFWFNIFKNIDIEKLNNYLLFTNDENDSLWINIIKNVKSKKMWEYFANNDYLKYWNSDFNYSKDPCDGARLTERLDDKFNTSKKKIFVNKLKKLENEYEFTFWNLAYTYITNDTFWNICLKKYSITI